MTENVDMSMEPTSENSQTEEKVEKPLTEYVKIKKEPDSESSETSNS